MFSGIMIAWGFIFPEWKVTSRKTSQVIFVKYTWTWRIRSSALVLHWQSIFFHIQTFWMEIFLFSPGKTYMTASFKKSQGCIWQQGKISYFWCGGSLVRLLFLSEGINNYVLVCMHVLSIYFFYLLEGLLEHGPTKWSVHPLRKVLWSSHRPISDSYIIFDKRICDFSASLGLYRFNRRSYGRESWSTPK